MYIQTEKNYRPKCNYHLGDKKANLEINQWETTSQFKISDFPNYYNFGCAVLE